jgi:hypothetical protein
MCTKFGLDPFIHAVAFARTNIYIARIRKNMYLGAPQPWGADIYIFLSQKPSRERTQQLPKVSWRSDEWCGSAYRTHPQTYFDFYIYRLCLF